MDVNKMIADMWKRICCIEGSVRAIEVGGSFWTIQGNLGIGEDHFLGTIESQPLIFKTNNTERMRVAPTGNIGVNTNDPTASFDVNGQIRIRGGSPAAGKILQSDANGLASWVTPSAGTTYTFESGLNEAASIVRLGGELLDNTIISSPIVGFDVILNGTVDSTNNNTTDAYLQVNTLGVGPAVGITSQKDGILIVASTLGMKISGGVTGANIAGSATGLVVSSSAVGQTITASTTGMTVSAGTIGISVMGGTQGINTSVGGITTNLTNAALIATSTIASTPTALIVKADNAGSISSQAIPLDALILRRNNGSSVAIPVGAGINFRLQMQQASTLLEAFRISAVATTIGGQNTDIQFWNLRSISTQVMTLLSVGQLQLNQYSPSQLFNGGTRMLTIDPTDGKVYTQVIPSAGTATVNAADQGLSLVGTTKVQLGTDVSAASDAALINTVREIPFTLGGATLQFTNRSNANLLQSFTPGNHTLQGTTTSSPSLLVSIVDNLASLTVNWNNGISAFNILPTNPLYIGDSAAKYIHVNPTSGIGINRAATAQLHIAAGSATAGTAPIKLTSGTLNTTAEVGALEFLTDKAYLTITTGAARKELALIDAALTAGRIPYVTTNGRLVDSSLLTWDNSTSSLGLTSTFVEILRFKSTSGATDKKNWTIQASPGNFSILAEDDSGFLANTFISATRGTGTDITDYNIQGGGNGIITGATVSILGNGGVTLGASFSGTDEGTIGASTTWNTTGTNIAGFTIGITDTASPANSPALVVVVGSATVFRVIKDGRTGINLTVAPTSMLHVKGVSGYNQVRMEQSYTPTGTADANGNTGDIAWDSDYLYMKTSAGWKRSALSTF